MIGAGAIVEHGAELDGAVLHAGARVGPGSIVRDSVVGVDAVCKPDVVLTDLTLVGAGASIPAGTNVSAGRVPPATE